MKEKTLKERWQSKTPKFWKRVQRWAIITGTAAGVILAAPITLPAIVITMAGYAVTAGTVAATLSQLTVDDNVLEDVTENK